MFKFHHFNSIEYNTLIKYLLPKYQLDKWIISIIENYIYTLVEETYVDQYINSKKICKYKTRFGLRDGEYKEYYINPSTEQITQLAVQTTYRTDKLCGKYEEWYSNGNKLCDCFYINIKDDEEETLHELYETWHENGKLCIQTYYNQGKLDGEYKEWFENGQLHICSYYKNNLRDGEYKEWYSSSQLSIQTSFKNNEFDGEYKKWFENGQLSVCSFYSLGSLNKI